VVGFAVGVARGAQAYQQTQQLNPLALQQQQQTTRTGEIALGVEEQKNKERQEMQSFFADPNNFQTNGRIDIDKINAVVPKIAPLTGADYISKYSTLGQATQDAAAQQRQMFDILNAQQTPYREAGYGALTNINQMLPYFTQQAPAYKPFTAADLKTNLAPNYEFMKQQGLGATGQAMNVGGGGSNVNLARTKFAEDYASNAYQNAVNN